MNYSTNEKSIDGNRQLSALLLMKKLMAMRRSIDESSKNQFKLSLSASPEDGQLVLRSIK